MYCRTKYNDKVLDWLIAISFCSILYGHIIPKLKHILNSFHREDLVSLLINKNNRRSVALIDEQQRGFLTDFRYI
jgi:hypothetical protein